MKNKISGYLILILAVAGFLVWQSVFNKNQTNLKVTFCNVGQGDAALIQFPKNNEEVLIDAGPDNSVLNCLGENMAFSDREISAVFLSHPDSDHIAGMNSILDKYKVDNVYWTYDKDKSEIFSKIKNKILEKKIPTKLVYAGETFWYQNRSLEILYPNKETIATSGLNSNDYSEVIRLEDDQVSFLFTGDIGKDVSNKILETYGKNSAKLKSAVYKVPHHGSKDYSPDFLSAVNPKLAIISVGKNNRYGHPSKEVLDFLNKNHINFLRTDQKENIKVESDGKEYGVK